MIQYGAIYQTTTNAEVEIQLLVRLAQKRKTGRFIDTVSQIQGGFTLVALTTKKLIGASDPTGLRPLVIGKLGHSFGLASEPYALHPIKAELVREVEPGQVVVISDSGLESFQVFAEKRLGEILCILIRVLFETRLGDSRTISL